MHGRRFLLLSALAALALAGCASTEGDTSPATVLGAGAAVPAAEMKFVAAAAATDLYEIRASQLAMQRAAMPAVRDYAQMLVKHHTASSDELKGILAARGVTPTPRLTAAQQAKMDQLSRLQGEAFDREYIRITGVKDHQAAIVLYDHASRTLRDPDLRAFAGKTLPVLYRHLKGAQDIAGTLAG